MLFRSAIAGVITGGVVSIVWGLLGSLGGIFEIYAMVPGALTSILAIILFSLLDNPPSKDMTDEFDSLKNSQI